MQLVFFFFGDTQLGIECVRCARELVKIFRLHFTLVLFVLYALLLLLAVAYFRAHIFIFALRIRRVRQHLFPTPAADWLSV